jgi:hypothetical protein
MNGPVIEEEPLESMNGGIERGQRVINYVVRAYA